MNPDFPVVLIESACADTTSGPGLSEVADALDRLHITTHTVTARDDVRALEGRATNAGAFVYSTVGMPVAAAGSASRAAADAFVAFVTAVRRRNATVPIYLFGERLDARSLPTAVLKDLRGFINAFEDTPEFVAGGIARAAQAYLDEVPPPFFRALRSYALGAADTWHTPGHSGGVAFLKTPVGTMFHHFFGQNLLRADVCNAVEELGQLLDHTGPVADAEDNAARIFSADHLYFVTNGTSTSNKIVWNSMVSPGDVVVVDRNCHKSVLHALVLTGAIPVFLNPTRDHGGLIGPIPQHEFSWDSIRAKIEANPFIEDKAATPRLLTLTQSTYDGILYNADAIKAELDGHIDALHFDEAWIPHAAFHDFYRGMHAISDDRPRCTRSMVFATQSTHKVLAGLSQASQILVQDAEQTQLDEMVFNEAFLMHTSTSPQYAIIASCDVAAAMMDGAGGRALVGESLTEALEFRRAMIRIAEELPDTWWFSVWGPDSPPREGLGERSDWQLSSEDTWHHFGGIAPGFTMLDPIKATVVTPGLKPDGGFEPWGVPAAVVTRYLAEHGIVVEKTGLYSFLIMFTIGVTKGRWHSLLSELQRFKDAYEENLALSRAMPRFASDYPAYAGLGLHELCQSVHGEYREHDVARLTTAMYVCDPDPAMLPAQAWAQMTRHNLEHVPIDDLEGRTSAVLLTPYPPGIPVLIPGERFNATIVDFLRFAQRFNQRYPGLETLIHGLEQEREGARTRLYVNCVRER